MASIRLSEGVRTRRESFGGLAYARRLGTTVELDRGALRLLELAQHGVSLATAGAVIRAEGLEPDLRLEEVGNVAAMLQGLGLVEPGRASDPAWRYACPSTGEAWPVGLHLTAPEAAHWAVTYRCDAGCPDCYAARLRRAGAELSTRRALLAIDRLARWGVFQLALGGGEPLLREDLGELVRHAADAGLSVHVTTNGEQLTPARLATLAGALTCLQVGIRQQDLLGPPPGGQRQRLAQVCSVARDLGLMVGANLILCRSVLQRLEEAVERLLEAGFRRLTLLRYKPPATLAQWRREAHGASELEEGEGRIGSLPGRHPDLHLRFDCALSFLVRRLPAVQARWHGLRGCVAGARIVALSPDGSLYPCSQMVTPRFRVGHLLREEPPAIWSRSPVLLRLRDFRSHPDFRRSACGVCRAVELCGGCRVFTHEGYGADPGCPGAVVEPGARSGARGQGPGA